MAEFIEDEFHRSYQNGPPNINLSHEFEDFDPFQRDTLSMLGIENTIPVDYAGYVEAFDMSLYKKNIQILRELQALCGKPNDTSDLELRILLEKADRYLPFLSALQVRHNIPKTRDTVVEEFERSGDRLHAGNAKTTERFTLEYMKCKDRPSTKTVVIGGHEMTRPLYQLAMEGLHSHAASLLVVDNHLDLHSSTNDRLDATPHKGNFLGHMLSNRNYPSPSQIVVAGVNPLTYKRMVLGQTDLQTRESTISHTRYFGRNSPYRNRVHVLSQDSFRSETGKFSRNPSYNVGRRSAQLATSRGELALYLSIDIDALSTLSPQGEIITGQEYSPTSFHISMGVQNLAGAYNTILQARKKGAPEHILRKMYIDFMNAVTNGAYPSEKLKKTMNKKKAPALLTTSQGIPEEAFQDYLQGVSDYCVENQILLGIPTGESGVMIGDIAEAGGLDYLGATAKRIQRINRMMHQAARPR